MKNNPKTRAVACWLLVLSALICVHPRLNASASAQTATAGVLLPWGEGEQVLETSAWTRQQLRSETDEDGQDARLSTFRATGRFRLNPADPDTLVASGFYDHLAITSADDALPQRLIDASVAVGKSFELGKGWRLTAAIGAGTAGSQPWSDDESLYALADLVASYPITDTGRLLLSLNYNGNRTILPDVPLPGIAYTDQLGETIHYTVGLPFASVTWTPTPRWKLDLAYIVPTAVVIGARYAITRQLAVFGRYDASTRGYHVDDDADHRRVFFEQSTAELGVRYAFLKQAAGTLAVGYAFEQKFTRGYDTLDTDTVRDIDPAPYLRAGFELSF